MTGDGINRVLDSPTTRLVMERVVGPLVLVMSALSIYLSLHVTGPAPAPAPGPTVTVTTEPSYPAYGM